MVARVSSVSVSGPILPVPPVQPVIPRHTPPRIERAGKGPQKNDPLAPLDGDRASDAMQVLRRDGRPAEQVLKERWKEIQRAIRAVELALHACKSNAKRKNQERFEAAYQHAVEVITQVFSADGWSTKAPQSAQSGAADAFIERFLGAFRREYEQLQGPQK